MDEDMSPRSFSGGLFLCAQDCGRWGLFDGGFGRDVRSGAGRPRCGEGSLESVFVEI